MAIALWPDSAADDEDDEDDEEHAVAADATGSGGGDGSSGGDHLAGSVARFGINLSLGGSTAADEDGRSSDSAVDADGGDGCGCCCCSIVLASHFSPVPPAPSSVVVHSLSSPAGEKENTR